MNNTNPKSTRSLSLFLSLCPPLKINLNKSHRYLILQQLVPRSLLPLAFVRAAFSLRQASYRSSHPTFASVTKLTRCTYVHANFASRAFPYRRRSRDVLRIAFRNFPRFIRHDVTRAHNFRKFTSSCAFEEDTPDTSAGKESGGKGQRGVNGSRLGNFRIIGLDATRDVEDTFANLRSLLSSKKKKKEREERERNRQKQGDRTKKGSFSNYKI